MSWKGKTDERLPRFDGVRWPKRPPFIDIPWQQIDHMMLNFQEGASKARISNMHRNYALDLERAIRRLEKASGRPHRVEDDGDDE